MCFAPISIELSKYFNILFYNVSLRWLISNNFSPGGGNFKVFLGQYHPEGACQVLFIGIWAAFNHNPSPEPLLAFSSIQI